MDRQHDEDCDGICGWTRTYCHTKWQMILDLLATGC